jgi:hypothetical protein
MIAGGATDAQARWPLVVLKDDKDAFPPYQASLVVRSEILARVNGLRHLLERLHSTICQDQIRAMNVSVFKCWEDTGEKADEAEIASNEQNHMAKCAKEVAAAFLKTLGGLGSGQRSCDSGSDRRP